MNERIRELIERAGIETQPAKLKIFKNEDDTVTSGGWEYPLEKFAELIVRECALVVFKKTGPKSALDVLEHFGVADVDL